MDHELARDLYLYSEFSESSIQSIVEKLVSLNNEDKEKLRETKEPNIKPIRLHIASFGGYTDYLRALLTVLDSMVAPIVTIVEGAAYSCGSMLSVRGDYRLMGENANLLIHPPSGGAFGEASKIKNETENMEQTHEWFIDHYEKHTNIDRSTLEEAFRTHKDWYLTAKECLELGLIDEIIPERKFSFYKKKKMLTGAYKKETITVHLEGN